MSKPISTLATNKVLMFDNFARNIPVEEKVVNGRPTVTSTWELTPDEIVQIVETGVIYVSVMAKEHEPIDVTATNPVS